MYAIRSYYGRKRPAPIGRGVRAPEVRDRVDAYYRWRPHPWHGLSPGPAPPSVVSAFVEITPFDLVKYEVDKITGYLKVERAQRTSSLPPAIRNNFV